jgi:hypothetical protein
MPEWYYQNDEGARVGPLTDDDFQSRLTAGQVTDSTRTWRSGLSDWTNYAAIRAHDARTASAPGPTTAVETPVPAAEAPIFAQCSVCGDQWPAHLLQGTPQKLICGPCQRKSAGDAWRRNLRGASGVSSGWGSWLFRCLLMAVVLGGLLFAKAWLKSEARKARRKPAPALDPRYR